ncbi:MAG: DUF2510 domain-containing protein [Actinomycetales bacterium]|nr:DUF2510 domain-containing protein [Actinomycetales bacterium]
MAEDSSPIAGWYPDPENVTLERWWNGVAWSDQRRPSTVPVANPLPEAPAAYAAPAAPSAPAASASVAAAPAPVDAAAAAATAPAQPSAAPYPAQPYAAQPYAAQPYAAPGYGAPAPYGYPPAPPSNGLALAGILTSGIGALLNWTLVGLPGIAGGILSILGVRRARELQAMGVADTRRGMAIAGIWIGFGGAALTWLLGIGWIVFVIASSAYY